MLTHIVCWKYKPEITEAQRAEHIARLRALPGLVPGIESFEAGADVLHLDRSFDTGLVAEFAGREQLDAYTDDPHHKEVVAIGKQIAETVISVDFISPG